MILSNLISYHRASLGPLAQTGSVDSRLNTDKSVLITQNFVFSGVWDSGWNNSPFVIKNVWHPGCSTNPCYF